MNNDIEYGLYISIIIYTMLRLFLYFNMSCIHAQVSRMWPMPSLKVWQKMTRRSCRWSILPGRPPSRWNPRKLRLGVMLREIRGFSGGILKADVSQVVLRRMYNCWEQYVLLGDKKWNARMRLQNSQACWNTTAWESNTKWFWERQWIWMAVMKLALNGGFPFRYVLASEMSVSTFYKKCFVFESETAQLDFRSPTQLETQDFIRYLKWWCDTKKTPVGPGAFGVADRKPISPHTARLQKRSCAVGSALLVLTTWERWDVFGVRQL